MTGEKVKKNAKGRGGITIDYIKSKDPPLIHNTKLVTHFDQFNGFNFLSIEINQFGIKAYNACNIDRKIQQLSIEILLNQLILYKIIPLDYGLQKVFIIITSI